MLKLNETQTVSLEIVDAARESLVIGQAKNTSPVATTDIAETYDT